MFSDTRPDLLFFTMVTKVWTDFEGRELRCYLNDKNLCFIEANSEPTEFINSSTGFVTLDIEDIDDLIKELRLIKSVMTIYKNNPDGKE